MFLNNVVSGTRRKMTRDAFVFIRHLWELFSPANNVRECIRARTRTLRVILEDYEYAIRLVRGHIVRLFDGIIRFVAYVRFRFRVSQHLSLYVLLEEIPF